MQSVCRFSGQCPISITKIFTKYSSGKSGGAESFVQTKNFSIYTEIILKGNIFQLNYKNYVKSNMDLVYYD